MATLSGVIDYQVFDLAKDINNCVGIVPMGDTTLRGCYVLLVNNGEPYEYNDRYTYMLQGKNAGNKNIVVSCELYTDSTTNVNYIHVPYTNNMVAYAGVGTYQISIYDGESCIETFPFKIFVSETSFDIDATYKSDEYKAFSDLINKIYSGGTELTDVYKTTDPTSTTINDTDLFPMVEESGSTMKKSSITTLLSKIWNYISTKLSTIATSGSYSDLTDTPTKLSDFTNDLTETDPTVPDWAKKSTKPEYTYTEVGALSENTKLSDLEGDETHRLVTDDEKTVWNSKIDKPSTATNKQVLTYSETSDSWIAMDASGGGATALSNLTDVSIDEPEENQVLTYDGTEWIAQDSQGGDTSTSYKTSDEASETIDDTDYVPLSDSEGNKKKTLWSNIKSIFDGLFLAKDNPIGTGSLSMNRASGTNVGTNSVALGSGNTATGDYSVALGGGNNALSSGAFAAGSGNTVNSGYAAAIGGGNRVSSSSSVAMGASNNVTSSGSIALGISNTVSGSNSASIGLMNTSSGSYSLAFGYYNTAAGEGSLVAGENNKTESAAGYSTVLGYNNTSSKSCATVIGRYNADEDKALIIGGGNGGNRTNIFTVDWSGNITAKDINGFIGTKGVWSSTGYYTTGAIVTYSGKTYQCIKDPTSAILPTDTTYWKELNLTNVITELEKNADIYGSTFVSNGRTSGTTVGTNSVAYGNTVEASGDYSHAEGSNTSASGKNAHAEGYNSNATGLYSHAEGSNTTSEGEGSHSEGATTKAVGKYSHAEGLNTQTTTDYQHVSGKYNETDSKKIFQVGIGTSDSDRKNGFEVDFDGNVYDATGVLRIQYTSLPDVCGDDEINYYPNIVQYLGNDDSKYKYGSFYKKISESSDIKYVWKSNDIKIYTDTLEVTTSTPLYDIYHNLITEYTITGVDSELFYANSSNVLYAWKPEDTSSTDPTVYCLYNAFPDSDISNITLYYFDNDNKLSEYLYKGTGHTETGKMWLKGQNYVYDETIETQYEPYTFSSFGSSTIDIISWSEITPSIPMASDSTLGTVKVDGETITIDSDGIITAHSSGGEGTTDYLALSNKPSINGITLSGDKSLSDLGIAPAGDYITDSSYVHTDNNFTNDYKTKLDSVAENANNYSLPTASDSVLGGVKVDNDTIKIDENGVIKANSSVSSLVLTDDTTGTKYKIGIDNGQLYIEEAE